MDISRLMVYDEQIEESKVRKMTKDGKIPMQDESSQPSFKKKFYNQESFLGNKNKVSTKNYEGVGYALERPKCTSCGKQHLGRCLADTDG